MPKTLNFCPNCGSNKLKESESFHKKDAAECVKCSHRFVVVEKVEKEG